MGDARDLNLVTHAVERADFAAVLEGLAQGAALEDAVAPHVRKVGPGPLAPHRRRIDTIFAAASVEAIMERLDRDGSDFARATAQLIRARSPQSLKIVFRQIRAARQLSLRECLAMEFRLATRVLASHDFREGVRAALVDKDRSPKWHPASLAAVAGTDDFFAPDPRAELF